jgi:hypothetical protein
MLLVHGGAGVGGSVAVQLARFALIEKSHAPGKIVLTV